LQDGRTVYSRVGIILLGDSKFLRAIEDSEVTSHFANMPLLYFVELWERWVYRVVVRYDSTMSGQSDRVAGSTALEHFDNIAEGD
jgi:hypothetical protein